MPIVLVSVGPGADADDRTGMAPDAPPAGPAGMSLVMPTRILVVGGGGREHALAWKLAGEPGVNEVVVAPGSAGIAEEPRVSVVPTSRGRRSARSWISRGRARASWSWSGPRRRWPTASRTH